MCIIFFIIATVVVYLFCSFPQMLRLYKEYASNHESATKLLQELVKKSKFVSYCKGIMNNADATGEVVSLTIGSLLITPIQRIPRYMLLIQDLIKHTLPNSPNYKDLEKADTVVSEVAYEVNECKLYY